MTHPYLSGTPWTWAALDTDARDSLNARAERLGCKVGAFKGRDLWRAGATGPLGRTDVFAKRCDVAMSLALDAYQELARKNQRIGEIAASVDYFTPEELEQIQEQSMEGVA